MMSLNMPRQAIKLGVNEYLLKPITVQEMHKVLQQACRRNWIVRKANRKTLRKCNGQLEENQAISQGKAFNADCYRIDTFDRSN